MKASDYIVEYLIEKGITDVFGYPGGMVTHLMDSFSRYQNAIKAHVTYNEQGAAMAACGYAQVSGNPGIAYATSGPGATNMITGICNAYMDSIPTIFITGQVNSFEQKGNLKVRQRGFQETDIIAMVGNVTKYAAQINSADKLRWNLDYAFYKATEGRKGPVLLDIAMDVTRAEINPEELEKYVPDEKQKKTLNADEICTILELLKKSSRPVLLIGNGLERYEKTDRTWLEKVNNMKIPVVSSMLATDIKAYIKNYYGFIGAYGDRTANFVVAKSDLVISIGSRLDIRQVGARRDRFAPDSMLIRIDIDSGELEYKVHKNEYGFCSDAQEALKVILDACESEKLNYIEWVKICDRIRDKLEGIDDKQSNHYVRKISNIIPENSIITTDVGQNQVWVAQSFNVKPKQRILFSGGHGAMGYSLPAAIGACLASGETVFSFNGDGGIQMNIQELQTIARENLSVKVFVFNNNALGMIRHFQEMYFHSNYYQTVPSGGFTSPDFEKIAEAYGFKYSLVMCDSDTDGIKELLENDEPAFIEVRLLEDTYVFPKLEYGKPNQDQEPQLDRKLYNYLMELDEENIDNWKD